MAGLFVFLFVFFFFFFWGGGSSDDNEAGMQTVSHSPATKNNLNRLLHLYAYDTD